MEKPEIASGFSFWAALTMFANGACRVSGAAEIGAVTIGKRAKFALFFNHS